MTPGALFQVLRGSGGHDPPARVTALRTQVDDPVAATDQIQVVLDDHDGMPLADEFAEGAEQFFDIGEVQSGGGFVEDEERRLVGTAAGFCQVTRQLEPLCLPAR